MQVKRDKCNKGSIKKYSSLVTARQQDVEDEDVEDVNISIQWYL